MFLASSACCACASSYCFYLTKPVEVCGQGEHTGSPLQRLVQWFKTMTTNEYIRGVKNQQWPPFNKKLWQRNYWEHIIRDEESLNRIRQYIIDNPLHWTIDSLHPAHNTKE